MAKAESIFWQGEKFKKKDTPERKYSDFEGTMLLKGIQGAEEEEIPGRILGLKSIYHSRNKTLRIYSMIEEVDGKSYRSDLYVVSKHKKIIGLVSKFKLPDHQTTEEP